MTGKLQWDGMAASRNLEAKSAEMLLRMAVMVQTTYMNRLNKSYWHFDFVWRWVVNKRTGKGGLKKFYVPTASKPGEYLRKRTGWLQAHILMEPTDPGEVARLGRVRVGYGKSGDYGAAWEFPKNLARKRKGLLDVVHELKPQLAVLGSL